MDRHQKPTIIHAHRYKIEKLLGTGVQGSAFLVEDLRNKKIEDKMKVLKRVPAMNMDPEETVDAQREANFLRKLNHPHVLKLFDSFVEEGYFCIVTEYCESGDLDKYLKELKNSETYLEESEIIDYITQLLMGLHEIHSKRILHRDLKPSNIFMKSGTLKIGDFGISRVLMSSIDRASTFCGAPLYMSPEVLQHLGYSTKADIWSLGVLLYKMCTFKNAFEGQGLMGVMFRVVSYEPEPLTGYSNELSDLSRKMLIKDPDHRPSTLDLLKLPIIQNRLMNSKNLQESNHFLVQDSEQIISPLERMKLRKQRIADKRAEELKAAVRDKQQINHHTKKSIENNSDVNKSHSEPFPIEDKLKYFSINNLKDTFELKNRKVSHKPDMLKTLPNNSQVGVGAEDDLAIAQPYRSRKISDSVYNYVPTTADDRPITPLKYCSKILYDSKFSWDANKEKILENEELAETYYLSQPDFEDDDQETLVPYSQTVVSLLEEVNKEDVSKLDTFQDDTIKSAFGTESKEKKIASLREACIQNMGKKKFDEVYKFIKKSKNRMNLGSILINKFKINGEHGFLVEQMIFLEESN